MPSETMDIAPSDIITPEIDSTARSSRSYCHYKAVTNVQILTIINNAR